MHRPAKAEAPNRVQGFESLAYRKRKEVMFCGYLRTHSDNSSHSIFGRETLVSVALVCYIIAAVLFLLAAIRPSTWTKVEFGLFFFVLGHILAGVAFKAV